MSPRGKSSNAVQQPRPHPRLSWSVEKNRPTDPKIQVPRSQRVDRRAIHVGSSQADRTAFESIDLPLVLWPHDDTHSPHARRVREPTFPTRLRTVNEQFARENLRLIGVTWFKWTIFSMSRRSIRSRFTFRGTSSNSSSVSA